MTLARYKELCKASDRVNETNDCMVKATAIAGRMSYQDAYNLCRLAGRKDRRGASVFLTMAAMKGRGYTIDSMGCPVQKNGSRYTSLTIGNRLKRGRYICVSKGHVFAVHNGEVCDWTNGRRHRIIEAYKVK